MSTTEVTVLPDALFLKTDRSGPVPLYFQISRLIEGAIRSGELPAGARLETEVALAARLGLSRPTVRRALQELVNKGLLVRRRGIGTQVVHGQINRSVALTSLYEDLTVAGQAPSQRVLQHEHVPADAEVAEQLGVGVGDDVLRVRRLRFADGVPLAVLENYLPAPHSELTVEALAQHSMYQLLRARGVSLSVATQRIGARRANADELALLDLARYSPLLTMDRTVFDNAGRPVEYGTHAYRPDLYSFTTTVVGR